MPGIIGSQDAIGDPPRCYFCGRGAFPEPLPAPAAPEPPINRPGRSNALTPGAETACRDARSTAAPSQIGSVRERGRFLPLRRPVRDSHVRPTDACGALRHSFAARVANYWGYPRTGRFHSIPRRTCRKRQMCGPLGAPEAVSRRRWRRPSGTSSARGRHCRAAHPPATATRSFMER